MAPEFEHEEVIVSVRYMLIEYLKKNCGGDAETFFLCINTRKKMFHLYLKKDSHRKTSF